MNLTVIEFDKEGNVINTYESVTQCAKRTGYSRSSIIGRLNGNTKSPPYIMYGHDYVLKGEGGNVKNVKTR